MSKKINVFIADDHEFVILGLKSYISTFNDIEVINQAITIKDTELKLLNQEKKIEIIVVDYSFGDGYGEQILNFIKTKNLDIKVIFLSAHDELALVHKMIKSGASAFVIKTDPIAFLVEAIYSVAKNEIYLSHALSKKLYNFTNSLSENEVSLITRRETEILKLFLQGLSSIEIADKLFISVSTVETHKKNLYKKFNVTSSAGLMQAAIKYKHLI
jgi:DNA-binding NarL/FixJ family response regulator